MQCPSFPSFSAFRWATAKAFVHPEWAKTNSIREPIRLSKSFEPKRHKDSFRMSEQEELLEPGTPGCLTGCFAWITYTLVSFALPSAVLNMNNDRNWWRSNDLTLAWNSTNCDEWLKDDVNRDMGGLQCTINFLTIVFIVICPVFILLDFELHWLAWQVRLLFNQPFLTMMLWQKDTSMVLLKYLKDLEFEKYEMLSSEIHLNE